MNKERDTDRDILLLSVFTFMTVGLWIFFELVKTAKTTTVTTNVQQIITPFSPKIDTDILNTLSTRRTY
ncbi:hypothetical protein A3A64_01785 [Candidatus Gottesmanbacteria bacterium RIFCSPLOWO2_01_FULL_48_11]|uniref:Uncharacterized protein n=3 Tax=Candidatus Gottesmaniibacteriota TaxID=1752720 RepID=A0A0G1X112_9BACT|nr:MAG: hypothetical protein UY16_C0002G0045 [Candidatus Gottesmanbacteria bacterium GW2011_GWA2_47_9]KKU96258.1 MAG: hypothetical protein UY27_C0002G0043 [Candidatus Gottesmanbacteria bacterium GW2011_GWA1_48_13]OGG27518.1 MAG: hypothetical protein A3A64_01785 [Candidatus Gottesmanbacteria bacterium RIFCSPLOWO2_01_FULL_48_11]